MTTKITAAMASTFNPLDYAHRLETAGVPKNQADVHASAMAEVLAGVAAERDVAGLDTNLRREMHGMEQRLSDQIDHLRTEMNVKIDALRTEMTIKIDALRTDMDAKFNVVNARIDGLETWARAEFTSVRTELAALRAEIASLRNEMIIHRWALGLIVAMNVAILFKLFSPA